MYEKRMDICMNIHVKAFTIVLIIPIKRYMKMHLIYMMRNV